MSFQALNWARTQKVSPSGAKFVLVMLANYADEQGYCYPSQQRLAQDTCQSARSVRTHLAALEKQDLITRHKRRGAAGQQASDGFNLNWHANQGGPAPDQAENISAGPGGKSLQTRRKISPNQAENISAKPLREPNQQTPPPPNGGDTPQRDLLGCVPNVSGCSQAGEIPGIAISNGTKRGTRLDPDWQPSPADRAYARERGFNEAEIDDMADSFRTHFTVLGGRAKKFVRWSGDDGAWGNWVRRENPKPTRGLRGYDSGRDRRGPPSVVAAARRVLGQA